MNDQLILFKNKLTEYNLNIQSLLFANPYSHSVIDKEGNLICCFCENENHFEEYKEYIPIYEEVLNEEINRVKNFFNDQTHDYISRLKFAFSIKGWEAYTPGNVSLKLKYSENISVIDSFEIYISTKRDNEKREKSGGYRGRRERNRYNGFKIFAGKGKTKTDHPKNNAQSDRCF